MSRVSYGSSSREDPAGTLAPDTHVGSEHIVTERLTGLSAEDLIIQLREACRVLRPGRLRRRPASAAVSAVVLGPCRLWPPARAYR